MPLASKKVQVLSVNVELQIVYNIIYYNLSQLMPKHKKSLDLGFFNVN